jgi:hypothetical protein
MGWRDPRRGVALLCEAVLIFHVWPTANAIPLPRAGPNVTQSKSETPDLPEPYCVKQNTKRSWCTNVIAAQQNGSDGDRDMGL